MESQKKIILGFPTFTYKPFATDKQRLEFLSSKTNINGRFLLTLIQYLQQHTKYFESINVVMSSGPGGIWPNGTLGGLLKRINCSEIDVGVFPVNMDNDITNVVDFIYPYKLEDFTFVTRQPVYKPHIFGIFQTISLPVWLTLILVLIMMSIVSYILLKGKYTFNTISLNVFAILMRQSSVLTSLSFAEKLLVYSWVVGAMVLCLSYDSVFLSFLSIPPVTKIKQLSDMALAVERGDYHCIAYLHTGVVEYWRNSEQKHLRIISTDIVKNKLSNEQALINFFYESRKRYLAFFAETRVIGILDTEKFFFAEDRFHETMSSMMVRRGFRYKELLDYFVHRMMASGLYFKYISDGLSLLSRAFWLLDTEDVSTNRKLTLTDVAPAFIFLLSGYFISFLVLIVEIWLGRNKIKSMKKNQKVKRKLVFNESPV